MAPYFPAYVSGLKQIDNRYVLEIRSTLRIEKDKVWYNILVMSKLSFGIGMADGSEFGASVAMVQEAFEKFLREAMLAKTFTQIPEDDPVMDMYGRNLYPKDKLQIPESERLELLYLYDRRNIQ